MASDNMSSASLGENTMDSSEEELPTRFPPRTSSMVTVNLSDIRSLIQQSESFVDDPPATDSICVADQQQSPGSLEDETKTKLDDEYGDTPGQLAEGDGPSNRGSRELVAIEEEFEASHPGDNVSVRSDYSGMQMSGHSGEVDWDGLEKSEQQEARDESCDEVRGSL